ncbi:NADH-quinone oxidoreductase subunit K [Deltaproteobacteria bacterium]|nr:NADH-quinone oxidoreductase subunit K [Deltaproteobacteria bacterium]
MTGPGLDAYLFLAAAMFAIGLFGVLSRRNLLAVIVSVELMANAANINLVAFSRFGVHPWGQALALFALALTVAEVVVGLALVILVSRTHGSLLAGSLRDLKE